MYKFSRRSINALNTAHADLQLIMNETISITNIDLGISEGYRPIARQNMLYKEGKSKIDGITRKGKHNYQPSMAVDIYPFIEGKVLWDEEHLSYLAGLIHGITEILYKTGRISHKIRWGGNWDMDGTILLDQSFDDRPHFELIKPK